MRVCSYRKLTSDADRANGYTCTSVMVPLKLWMPGCPFHLSAPISSGPLDAMGEVSVSSPPLSVPFTYSWTAPVFTL